MKFLHLADLHIGKRLNDVSLLEDQKYALQQALEIAEGVDGILIAGDIYDKPNPSSEAMSLFDWFLTSLVKLDKKVFMISGNHDSSIRISYFSDIIEKQGVYSSSEFEGVLQTVDLEDEYGPLHIHLLPFIKPVDVKRFYPDEEIGNDYQKAVEVVLKNSPVSKQERNIILVHQFITGSERSDSEEISVGGIDNISYEVFDDFDYVALGHIHKPQQNGRETVRYSGSLLKYSFSETEQVKSFCIIDVKEKGNIELSFVPIKFMRDVRDKEGYLNDLLKMDPVDDYVRVILKDEEVAPDSRVRLLTVFPNMLKFVVSNSSSSQEYDIKVEQQLASKSIEELFIDFYSQQNNDNKPTEKQLALLRKVIEEVREEER